MNIQSFGTPEEMEDALQRMREDAKAGLHPEQAALSYGHTWVEFADVGQRIIYFGRTFTEIDIVSDEGASPHPSYVRDVLAGVDADLQDGVMFGKAWSKADPAGTIGVTHKANVWPIETRMFIAARVAGWDIDRLDETGRVLLQIAYSAWRAHRLAAKPS